MQVTISGKSLAVTNTLREYIESRVSRLDRFLPNIDEARVDLSVQNSKSAGDRHTVQLTLRANGAILRAEDRSGDVRTSVDAVMAKMQRQIERFKGKHWRSQNRLQAREEQAETPVETVERELVRIKRFQTRPMVVDEAIEQMELLSHDFFIFFNVDEEQFSVVYRRRDGGYGLLVPELA
ncbi:MAG: ribosome-associated translation inhibitor RaiA [Chloroflexi bacterium]|jgi:putative sigma-54 modulation protein|nr:ribosome-associated translation inhibitor RaiA [Chloroflexota bacterium]